MSYSENMKDLAGATVITTGLLAGLGFMAYGIYRFYEDFIKPESQVSSKDEVKEEVKEQINPADSKHQDKEPVGEASKSKVVPETQPNSNEQSNTANVKKVQPQQEQRSTRRTRINPEDLKPSVFHEPQCGVEGVFSDLIREPSGETTSRITDPPRQSNVQFGRTRQAP